MDADSTPNPLPEGSRTVLDATHLAFVDLRSPQTVSNVTARPAVEVTVVDPVRRTRYRVRGRGRGRVLTEGAEFVAIVNLYTRRGFGRPVETAVPVGVPAVTPVLSPVHDSGTPEADVVARRAARLQACQQPHGDVGVAGAVIELPADG